MSRFLDKWNTFFAKATDASTEYGEAAGLSVLSTLTLGRRVLAGGPSGIPPNLFLMLVGESSVARKSTTVTFARKMIEEVDPKRVGPRDYTPEALLKWITTPDPGTKKGRSKLCLFAEEFGSDLARSVTYAKTMKADFCSLYDGESFEKVRMTGTITVSKPRVNMFAAAAYQMLASNLKSEDWASGYMMRFIYVQPTKLRPKFLLQPAWPKQEWDCASVAATTLREDLAKGYGALGFESAAEAYFTHWLGQIDQFVSGLTADAEIKGVYLGRFRVNVQKIALLYQLDIDPMSPDIGMAATDKAIKFAVRALWPSFEEVYARTTRDDVKALTAAIQERVRALGEVSRRDLTKEFGVTQLTRRVLETCVWSGSIVEVSIAGMPVLRWRS